MADIAMCVKKDCPSFDKCYRAQAVKSMHQNYMAFDNKDADKCDHFIYNEYKDVAISNK